VHQGRPSQIGRALLNLAVNARDAMPAGGVFSIKTQAVVPKAKGLREPNNTMPALSVLLQVTDTGEGIHVEKISKIFRPFFTTKSETKGNGLGLAMVERMVKQCGGFITVES
jgi:two-component system, cell cycle sensor histidine kinase and response regulator CckA